MTRRDSCRPRRACCCYYPLCDYYDSELSPVSCCWSWQAADCGGEHDGDGLEKADILPARLLTTITSVVDYYCYSSLPPLLLLLLHCCLGSHSNCSRLFVTVVSMFYYYYYAMMMMMMTIEIWLSQRALLNFLLVCFCFFRLFIF